VRVDSKLDWETAIKLGIPAAVKLAGALLDELMPAEEAGRFRLIAVSGTNGKTDVAARVHALLASTGIRVGSADQHDDLTEGTLTNAGIQRLLMNPLLEAAVIEVSEIGVLERGAPFDYASVAIVTNLGEGDHLGKQYLEARDFAKKAIRTPVDVVRKGGFSVLNYDDSEVRELAKHSAGRVLFFTLGEPDFSVHLEECEVPGWCYVEGGKVWAGWSRESAVVILEGTPLPSAGWLRQNVLAALGAGWVLGAPAAALQKAAQLEEKSVLLAQVTSGLPIWCANARNAEALNAGLLQVAEDTPRERLGLILSVSADWRSADAAAIAAQCQGLGAVALVVDASSGSVGTERAEQLQAALSQGAAGSAGTWLGIFSNARAALVRLAAVPTSEPLRKILVQTRSRAESTALASQLGQ
jgi:cyanophycin synthetase